MIRTQYGVHTVALPALQGGSSERPEGAPGARHACPGGARWRAARAALPLGPPGREGRFGSGVGLLRWCVCAERFA